MSKAYEQAGVNIEAGYEAVKRMKSHVERTNRLGVMGGRLVALVACLTCHNLILRNLFLFQGQMVLEQS